MRDLRSDWRRWTRSERIFGILTLPVAFAIVALPYFIAA